jgi:hypothetical protein
MLRKRRKGILLLRVLSAAFKLALVSLMTGAGLSALDIQAADILNEIGMTPENVLGLLERGAIWAIPNLVLGSMVILPIWLVVYLLRPPRG